MICLSGKIRLVQGWKHRLDFYVCVSESLVSQTVYHNLEVHLWVSIHRTGTWKKCFQPPHISCLIGLQRSTTMTADCSGLSLVAFVELLLSLSKSISAVRGCWMPPVSARCCERPRRVGEEVKPGNGSEKQEEPRGALRNFAVGTSQKKKKNLSPPLTYSWVFFPDDKRVTL